MSEATGVRPIWDSVDRNSSPVFHVWIAYWGRVACVVDFTLTLFHYKQRESSGGDCPIAQCERPAPRPHFPAAGPGLPDGVGHPQGFSEWFHLELP